MHGGDGDSTFIVFGRLKTFDGDDEKEVVMASKMKMIDGT
jgi:hypothetical protein